MTDELESSAPPELDPPAIANEQPVDQPEDVPSPLDAVEPDDATEGDEPDVEFVTVERNGRQYQVPKDLEGEFLMQSDYTKKTQGVAERQRELAAQAESLAQQAQATDEELNARATIKGVEGALAEYRKLSQGDWDYHFNADPLAAQKAWVTFQQLKEQHGELTQTLSRAEQDRTAKAQHDFAKRRQEAVEYASKNIPGWSEDLGNKVLRFAAEDMGLDEPTFRRNLNPAFLKLLHRAYVGDQAMKKQSAAPRPQTPAPAPLTTVAARANPTARQSLRDLANSDDLEAYAAARKAGRG